MSNVRGGYQAPASDGIRPSPPTTGSGAIMARAQTPPPQPPRKDDSPMGLVARSLVAAEGRIIALEADLAKALKCIADITARLAAIEAAPPPKEGAPGPAGPQGERGERGEPGQDGKDGAPGEQGPTGPQGEIGPRGRDGFDGNTGVGVAAAVIDGNGDLQCTYTDGRIEKAGRVWQSHATRKVVEHVRDPETNRIIKSVVTETDEE